MLSKSRPALTILFRLFHRYFSPILYHSKGIAIITEHLDDSILGHLKYVDDLVVAPNGEIVDWAVGSASEPYLTTKFQGEGKEKVREALIGKAIETVEVLELN